MPAGLLRIFMGNKSCLRVRSFSATRERARATAALDRRLRGSEGSPSIESGPAAEIDAFEKDRGPPILGRRSGGPGNLTELATEKVRAEGAFEEGRGFLRCVRS